MTHPDNSTPAKRKRDPGGTRKRLVRSALDLFTTVGFHASTTQHIAQRAGVAEGTIYRHFKSKELLLNEIFQAAVAAFQESVTQSRGELPAEDVLRGVARNWIAIAETDGGLVKLVFVNPPLRLLDKRSRAVYRDFRAVLEKLLAAGKSVGSVKRGSVELWTDVWLQTLSLALEKVASDYWGPEDETTQKVVEAAWDAIARKESSTPPASEHEGAETGY